MCKKHSQKVNRTSVMANDSDSDGSTTIDWAALPSGFRERFLILLLTGVLFTAYLASTVWVDAKGMVVFRFPAPPVGGDQFGIEFSFFGIEFFNKHRTESECLFIEHRARSGIIHA